MSGQVVIEYHYIHHNQIAQRARPMGQLDWQEGHRATGQHITNYIGMSMAITA